MSDLTGNLGDLQRRFWTQLLTRASEQGVRHHTGCRPCAESFLPTGAGRTGLTFEYQVYQRDATAIQLYLSHENRQCNETRYAALCRQREEIAERLGMQLNWNLPKLKKKCCSVQYRISDGGLRDAGDRWPELQTRMIDAMDRFVTVLRPYVVSLPC